MTKRWLLALAAVALCASADEGMWTYNGFPASQVGKKYGFTPDQKWLDHVRLSSARLAGGCSGSFVSADGLVMTNHHCAHECIEQLSTAQKDFVASGFYAKTQPDEVKCPEIEINQLLEITDVTAEIGKATSGLSGDKYAAAKKATMARLEKACATSETLRCDVVTLYHGGRYDLYKYRRYQDVRLVFAPEFAIAFFGGNPDNFNFPRYDLDVSFLRVYDDGKPARLEHFLKWSTQPAKDGDLAFVSGHPGGTDRLLTVAELADQRRVNLPWKIARYAELRGLLTGFQARGAEQKRHSTDLLFSVENSLKVYKGRQQALEDPKLFAAKEKEEAALRKKVAAGPKKALYAGAWDAIDKALAEQREMRDEVWQLEGEFPARQYGPLSQAFQSELFRRARWILRAAEEAQKPNDQRLREYAESNLPVMKQYATSNAPVFDDLEIATLTFSLTQMREALTPDSPLVQKILGKKSPAQLATEVVTGSRLKDPAVRKALWDGGKAAVDASQDPMIQLARLVDADARRLRTRFEDGPDAVIKKNEELVARAKFDAYGTSTYPDATFTLRLSYGTLRGFEENGRHIAPLTKIAGAFERATGQDPFALPASWLAAKSKLALDTPMNLCTDNDIIGGNSGSPMVNKAAEVIGLVFDGNIHSLGGDYFFGPAQNRTVAVHSSALTEALSKIYGADRVVEELTGKPMAR